MDKTKSKFNKISVKEHLAFIKKNRVNFSAQADAAVEKIKAGEVPTSTDYFVLLNTNQEQIDQRIMFDDITNRMNKGRITYEDVDYLIDKLGSGGKFDKALRRALHKKADQNNYEYAKDHKDEFTQKELEELEKKYKNADVKDAINEELNEILSC